MKNKITWRPRFDKGRWMFFGNHGETHYTIAWHKEVNAYCVEDSHGAVWGAFKNQQKAMDAVEKHVLPPFGSERLTSSTGKLVYSAENVDLIQGNNRGNNQI